VVSNSQTPTYTPKAQEQRMAFPFRSRIRYYDVAKMEINSQLSREKRSQTLYHSILFVGEHGSTFARRSAWLKC
jgi:hypothetical protein